MFKIIDTIKVLSIDNSVIKTLSVPRAQILIYYRTKTRSIIKNIQKLRETELRGDHCVIVRCFRVP